MTSAIRMIDVHRGDIRESYHVGHAVVCDASGEVRGAWGDPEAPVLPRSAIKMIQALPLVESGAAEAAGLEAHHLALACASHQGASIHTDLARAWLSELGLSEDDLRCGAHPPEDRAARHALIRAGEAPAQVHNNCSGKHVGFLTLARHLGAGPEYLDPDHPVQRAVRDAFEDVTGAPSLGMGIDGCSAPNFATTMTGLARAMARFATAASGTGTGTRERAAARLVEAMVARPELVAGETAASTTIMRAAAGPLAAKSGAEGVFTAILPAQGLGVALKICDGAGRASESAITAILVHLGALDPAHPDVAALREVPVRSWRGLEAGRIAPAPGFPA